MKSTDTPETQEVYYSMEQRLQEHYDKITKEVIVRSRAQWLQQGEKGQNIV